jgi:hypothetical protein
VWRKPGGGTGPVIGPGVRLGVASYRTCRLVFRMRLDRALSCFDSYALERRLGSGLLLRHPQVSNQNSKRADSIRREGETGKNLPSTVTLSQQRHTYPCRFRQSPVHHIHPTHPVTLHPAYRPFFCLCYDGNKSRDLFFLFVKPDQILPYLFRISFFVSSTVNPQGE